MEPLKGCYSSMKVLSTFLLVFIVSIMQLVSAEPLPVKAYGNLPHMNAVKLSSSGRYLSYLKNQEGRLALVVHDLDRGESAILTKADNMKMRLNWYKWASEHILLLSYSFASARNGTKTAESRLYKYNLLDQRPEFKPVIRSRPGEHVSQSSDNLISLLPNEPDHILLSLDLAKPNNPSVYKVNLLTGKRTVVKRYSSNIGGWYADQQGRIRLGVGSDGTRVFYRFKDLDTNKWREIWQYELFDAPDIEVLGFDLDPNILYLKAEYNGRYALFKVNMMDPELKRQLLFANDNYDFEGRLLYSPDSGEVIGYTQNDRRHWRHYWHQEYKRLQLDVNHTLPEQHNYILSMDEKLNRYVLASHSKKGPTKYYLGDREKKAMYILGEQYPLISEKNVIGKQKIQYAARDGLTIEGYLSIPEKGKKQQKLPAVIIPFGGPFSRNYTEFDYWSELLANNGYVVLQPNLRGSSGYGIEFEKMGVKSWGKSMQDDVEDAAKWLVTQGMVDQKQICIAGSGYGGYVALMSAALQSNTFKCAASFAGISDLERVVFNARRYTNKKIIEKRFGKDWNSLRARSPLNLADKMSIPVLLIHGESDRSVNVQHSQDMFEALKDKGKQVEYIELSQGDHFLSVQQHRVQTLSSMLDFFNKHLN